MTLRQQQHSPAQPEPPTANADGLSEETLGELLYARREMLRWKTIAKQHEEHVRQLDANSPWLYALIRIIPKIKHHWKLLLLLTVGALAMLPILPLILVVIIFPKGRKLLWSVIAQITATFPGWRIFLWSLSEKIGASDSVLGRIWLRLMKGRGLGRGEYNKVEPLVYKRPKNNAREAVISNAGQRQWHLLQQLSPQTRFSLQDFGLTRQRLIQDSEVRQLLSTSRAETSLLRIVLAKSATEDPATVYS
ncbi:MAG: hypothetical protein P8J79_12755 [Halioglobus sp.]|nr:hypothetical protein [Halioglobus sp.]